MHRPTALVLNTLLLAISIAAIVVAALVLPSESLGSSDGLPVFDGRGASPTWGAYIIAPGLSYASLKASLAAGCIGGGAALVMFHNILSSSNRPAQSYSGALASAATVITIIIAFVWSFVATYTSSHPYLGPFPETFNHDTVGEHGTYSFESWNCQVVPLRIPDQRGQAKRWCALSVSIYHKLTILLRLP